MLGWSCATRRAGRRGRRRRARARRAPRSRRRARDGGRARAALDAVAERGRGAVGALGIAAHQPGIAASSRRLRRAGGALRGPFVRRRRDRRRARRRRWRRRGWARPAASRTSCSFGVADHTPPGSCATASRSTARAGARRRSAWLALNPVEREDYRKTGCLEAEVAAAGIVRRLIWRIKAGDRSRVQDAVERRSRGDHASSMVLDAARAGDGVAISVVRDTAKYLGMAAANLVAHRRSRRCSCSAASWHRRRICCSSRCARRSRAACRAPMMEALRVVPATLGADAAAIGAARLALPRRMIVLSGADAGAARPHLSPGTLVIEGGRIAEIRSGAACGGHPRRSRSTATTSCPGSSTCTCTASTASTRSTAATPSRRSPRGSRATA